MHSIGYKSTITALTSNTIVTIIKFSTFLLSGSAVILSESIHSFADTLNQAFLLIGIKRSEKPADDHFNYGYKGERFFWSLLSACGIFFLGAGVTTYHGIKTLIHPEHVEFNAYSVVILVASFIFEGIALLTAYRELKRLAGKQKLINYYHESADPTLIAIIYEDSAALVGILIALLSLFLVKITGNPIWDSIGSIFIGILLGIIAISLININRKLLIGRSVPKSIRKRIFTILTNQKIIEEIHDFKTVMIATDGYRVKAEVEINGHFLADKIFESRDFKKEYEGIKDYGDFVHFCADFSDEITRTLGKEIDRLEDEIETAIPTVKHIDIESN